MAKLFTHHDRFQLHKIFGLLALVNFAYRFLLFLGRGYAFCHVNNDACSRRDIYFDTACVLLHACLSWSSLMLPVPKKRNFNSPMIWTEFRWHSIIFATRSVIATILSIFALWPSSSSSSSSSSWVLMNYLLKVALTLGTCMAADMATKYHGCRTQRTTNAMAYPDYLIATPSLQQRIKLNYSMAQMSATVSCLTEDATLSFLSLYAIQGAAFLLTLRRKNLIATRTVHFVYQLQLCIMYLPAIVGVLHYSYQHNNSNNNKHADNNNDNSNNPIDWPMLFVLGGLTLFAGYMRMERRASKVQTWTIAIFLWNFFLYFSPANGILLWFHTHPVGIAYVIFSHVNEYQRAIRHYLPIFLGRVCQMPPQQLAVGASSSSSSLSTTTTTSTNKKNDDDHHATTTTTTKHEQQQPQSLLSRDLVEYDMVLYPNRRQRFFLVFVVLLGTHFQLLERVNEFQVWRTSTAAASTNNCTAAAAASSVVGGRAAVMEASM